MTQTLTTHWPSLPVYQQVANALEHAIEEGRLQPGQRIPSLRQLCDRYTISDVTAKRAIRRLRDRGVIHTRPGSGAFVSEGRPARTQATRRQQVGLLTLGTLPKPVYQHEIECLTLALQAMGHPMMFNVAPDAADLPKAIAHQRDHGTHCLIFLPRHGQWVNDNAAIALLQKTRLPLLILETIHDSQAFIAADIAGGIRLAADHLHALGHRHLCLISAFDRKIQAFEQVARDKPALRLRHDVLRVSDDSQQGMLDVTRQLLAMSPRPTAVIANNDHLAEALVVHCLQTGLRVPQDISIMGFDDTPAHQPSCPIALSTIHHPAAAIAQAAADWAHLRMTRHNNTGRKLRQIVPCMLVKRASTCPPLR